MSMLGGTALAGANRSLLGTIGGLIGGVGGFITGGPAGAVAGATAGREIGDAVNGPGPGQAPTPPPPKPIVGVGGQVQVGGYGLGGGISFTGPSSSPGPGALAPLAAAGTPCGMRGYHLNKSKLNYSKTHGQVPTHTMYVRNRHMHFGNTRAAQRAIRRLKGAHRIFKKIDKLIGHHRSVRRAPFRKR